MGLAAAVILSGCSTQKAQPSLPQASPSPMQTLPIDWKKGDEHRYAVLWKRDDTIPANVEPKMRAAMEIALRNETVGEVEVRVVAHSGTTIDLVWEPRIDTPPPPDISIQNGGALVHEMYRYARGLKLELRWDTDPAHMQLQVLNLAESRHALLVHIQGLLGAQAARIGCGEESDASRCTLVGKTDELLTSKLLKGVTPFFDCVGMRYEVEQPRRWTVRRPIPNSEMELPVNYEVSVDEIDAAQRTLRGHVRTQPDAETMRTYFAEVIGGNATKEADAGASSALASLTSNIETDCRMDTQRGWPLRTERTERAEMQNYHGLDLVRYEAVGKSR